eukprot:gb/GECG01001894.1/.p1 GENE.gb/GECG01001894.1/~~gb/GECG01001894.1/.p1  ORF type:complete len:725 (+),score=86.36 gb/GECG01001894.1/:1-2175(+)
MARFKSKTIERGKILVPVDTSGSAIRMGAASSHAPAPSFQEEETREQKECSSVAAAAVVADDDRKLKEDDTPATSNSAQHENTTDNTPVSKSTTERRRTTRRNGSCSKKRSPRSHKDGEITTERGDTWHLKSADGERAGTGGDDEMPQRQRPRRSAAAKNIDYTQPMYLSISVASNRSSGEPCSTDESSDPRSSDQCDGTPTSSKQKQEHTSKSKRNTGRRTRKEEITFHELESVFAGACVDGRIVKFHEFDPETCLGEDSFAETVERSAPKLPDYNKLSKLKYTTPKIRHANIKLTDTNENDGVCECANQKLPDCGSWCLNRMTRAECTPNTCSLGGKCGNRPFSLSQKGGLGHYATHTQYTGQKGFGVFADENIPEDSFVVEYIGEVIDSDECERRLWDYKNEGTEHFYLMEIGSDLIIDAGRSGNMARFINHSCAPNLVAQKWKVKNETRVGLFTCRDIKAGEELAYDYQFSHFTDSPFQCRCGAPTCRGYLTTQTKADSTVLEAINKMIAGATSPEDDTDSEESSSSGRRRLNPPRSVIDKDEVLFSHSRVSQPPETMLWNSTPTIHELRLARKRKLFRTGLNKDNTVPVMAPSASQPLRKQPGSPSLISAKRRRILDLYYATKRRANKEKDPILLNAFWVWLDMASKQNAYISQQSEQDLNNQTCTKCSAPGSLLCCDFCPNAYHLSCLNMTEYEVPAGKWWCPQCRKFKSSRKIRNTR